MSEIRIGQTVADWQPIETAPKDGTWLLLVCPAYFPFQGLAAWIGRWADAYGNDVCDPTHWAYLPPPPEVQR